MTPATWAVLALLAVPVVLLLATAGCVGSGTSTGTPPTIPVEQIPPVTPVTPPKKPTAPPTPPPTYEQTVLNTMGLKGYWRLGEMSGATTADNRLTKGVLYGRYFGGITLQLKGALEPKDPDTAAQFLGTNGFVEVDNMPTMFANEVTVELWAKLPTAAANWGVLVGCYQRNPLTPLSDTVFKGYRLRIRWPSGSGNLEIEATVGGMSSPLVTRVPVGKTPTDPTPAWHYVALTYLNLTGQEKMELYVDGKPEGKATGVFTVKVDTPPAQPAPPLRFGAWKDPFGVVIDPYSGLLDEVAVYSQYLDLAPNGVLDQHFKAAT
jgi:hypothetical protein